MISANKCSTIQWTTMASSSLLTVDYSFTHTQKYINLKINIYIYIYIYILYLILILSSAYKQSSIIFV